MEDVAEIEEAEFVVADVGRPCAFAADAESLSVPMEEAVVVEVISSSYYLVEAVLAEIVLA